MIKYPHLFLADWPFHTIPEDEYCTFIADRKQLKGDVNNLLKNFCRIDHSTINILWAWYGAGKTHTLKYLSHQCKGSHTAFLSIYNEFPKETKSFLNLYQFFIEKVNIELIKNAFLEVFTSPRRDEAQKQLYYDYPDLSNAMKTLCMESGDKATIAMYWLRAQNVPLRDLSKIGITVKIVSGVKQGGIPDTMKMSEAAGQ
jgi:hypothetical protein